MIFLLNRERVLLEVVELARLKIAGVLMVPSRAVTARLEMKSGSLVPVFDVDAEQAKGPSREELREVIATVYGETTVELSGRLAGLEMSRHEVLNGNHQHH